jgi:hypothetical protein
LECQGLFLQNLSDNLFVLLQDLKPLMENKRIKIKQQEIFRLIVEIKRFHLKIIKEFLCKLELGQKLGYYDVQDSNSDHSVREFKERFDALKTFYLSEAKKQACEI